MDDINGKYVQVKLSGKYGVVNYTMPEINGVIYYWIVLNNFTTTIATLDEITIIY